MSRRRRACVRGGDAVPGLATVVTLTALVLLTGCGHETDTESATPPAVAVPAPIPGADERLQESAGENAESGEPAAEADARTLRVLADADGDGRLSKDEFLAYMAARDAERPAPPEPTAAERKRLRNRDAGQPMLKGQRSALLKRFDLDGDGALSPAEQARAREYLDAQESLEQGGEQ